MKNNSQNNMRDIFHSVRPLHFVKKKFGWNGDCVNRFLLLYCQKLTLFSLSIVMYVYVCVFIGCLCILLTNVQFVVKSFETHDVGMCSVVYFPFTIHYVTHLDLDTLHFLSVWMNGRGKWKKSRKCWYLAMAWFFRDLPTFIAIILDAFDKPLWIWFAISLFLHGFVCCVNDKWILRLVHIQGNPRTKAFCFISFS